MDENIIQEDIKSMVREELFSLLERYNFSSENLESILKWKPIVLIIGNYSSGKSTLVNELLGKEIQRTGQAPTDDSFTIITSPGHDEKEGEIPGPTLINDNRYPFTALKTYSERLASHLRMKLVKSRLLENLAIIDSPGMLDSVTEKGRGYDFPKVIGDLAKLADLIVLMFDPHKAGTIKETYTTIRNTLPESTGEDRIVFVMSRIDECDNLPDLVRSYGTLCWNLSQMTGRKDIPRIYLTFSVDVARNSLFLDEWIDERNQLKVKMLEASGLRLNHILHDIEKQAGELRLVIQAMTNFSRSGLQLLKNTIKGTIVLALSAFFLLDIICQNLTGLPENTFLSSFFAGSLKHFHFYLPVTGFISILLLSGFFFAKWQIPRYIKKCCKNVDQLATLKNTYEEDSWERVKDKVVSLLENSDFNEIRFSHKENLNLIDNIINNKLQKYYSQLK